jgi:aminoglycoside phosphotransferase (APT) family kinase protein
MIIFACPHCSRGLEAPEDQAGRDTKCPGCGQSALTPSANLPTLPGYEILQELGRGGNAVVYKARQMHPRRLVAVKMILAGEHAGAEAVARFRREAEALARLAHPNIVPIHQIGEYAGRPFLILEYVEGDSLARHLKGRQFSFTDAATLVGHLARAVHHAHQRGILHRDLKPANILLDAAGQPHVTDFGLAKLLDSAKGLAASARTQSGAVLGTPGYMAPEQAGSKGKPIGPATDVWALGAILYELLSGRLPFKGATAIETLVQVASAEPVAPSRLRASCPRELDLICLKCLEKDPGKRYASALALAEDLGRYLAGEPILPQPRRPLRSLARLVRRHREAAFVAAGAAVALAVVGLILLLPAQPKAPVPPPATRPEPAATLPEESPLALRMRRMQQGLQMRRLASALRSLHQAQGAFPPPAITDPRTGQPLLSWRVALLPHVGEEDLYREFKLDEAWDSPHNRPLVERMPDAFVAQGTQAWRGLTPFQVLVGPGTAFEAGPGGAGRALREFTDGTAGTILVVEAAAMVEWTKPADVVYDPKGPLPALGRLIPEQFSVALVDGSAGEIRRDAAATTLRALISRNGGESLPAGAMERVFSAAVEGVSGRLTVAGAPCPGGEVRFHAQGDPTEVVYRGRAEADGTYRVPGIERGAYRVSVTGPAEGKVRVPARFADPATSGLQVQVDVGQGDKQTFDIALDSGNEKAKPRQHR